jgi:Fe(3+) ions import ATP-binding protein fbpC 2
MLIVKNLSYTYTNTQVLKNIDFSLTEGEILSIVGASGSGKSTLLKAIYGLFDLEQGKISWKGTPVLGPSHNLVPGFAKMKYLAQDFGLMPYMTVEENVGKYLSNLDLPKKRARVAELLEMTLMQDYAKVKPIFLSGGQQQRVGLAQALAQAPEVLLLDEPFSQTDSFLKNTIRQNLFAFLKTHRITALIATHESQEALGFSDRIMIIREGEQVLIDTPERVYHSQDAYVASLFDLVNKVQVAKEQRLYYPHQISVVAQSDWQVQVEHCFFQGSYYLLVCKGAEGRIYVKHTERIEKEKKVFLKIGS